MPEITVNLIHDLKMKRALRHKPPFVGGLRSGFLRMWFFVAVKVLFIFALVSGMNLMGRVEENVDLLDKYIRNDFSIPAPELRVAKKSSLAQSSLDPRGPAVDSGVIAGEQTSLPQEFESSPPGEELAPSAEPPLTPNLIPES